MPADDPEGAGSTATPGDAADGPDTPDDAAAPDDDAASASDTGSGPPPAPRIDTLTVDEGPPVVCADPSRRATAPYDRSTLTAGRSDWPWHASGGVAVADLDADGREDVVVVSQDVVDVWWQTETGDFEGDRLLTAPIDGTAGHYGATAADADDDGDLDLFITFDRRPNTLLRNDGDRSFADATRAAGVAGPLMHASGASAWGDMDGDGDLDLSVAGLGIHQGDSTGRPVLTGVHETLLYENLGGLKFREVTRRIPEWAHDLPSFNATWQDLDGDTLPDLVLVNDYGETYPSVALRNTGTAFEREPAFNGLSAPITGMGMGLGDLNRDGVVDLVLPGWDDLGLLLSTQGSWFEQAAALGFGAKLATGQGIAWGTEVVDLDHDGLEDIIVAFGFIAGIPDAQLPPEFLTGGRRRQPDGVFQQQDTGRFVDVASAWGMGDTASTRAVAVGDLNGDGWPDVVKNATDDDAMIYRSRCGVGSWLRVRLDQGAPNAAAIGATVAVRADGITHTRWVRAGGTGYASSNPSEVHVGLADATLVDQITVTWPDGTMDVAYDVGVDRTVTLTRRALR